MVMNRNLDADTVVEKVEILHQRIHERFPERNLTRLSADLCVLAQEARQTAAWIARPHTALRVAIWGVIVVLVALIVAAFVGVSAPAGPIDYAELVQVIEAAINDIILLGATILFLLTAESRFKRHRALQALHQLRSMAHVIDMYQLTKDPVRMLGSGPTTASSPRVDLDAFQLTRYLDYCSEMLSFIGKIAALYVQDFDDGVALAAASEVQSLTTALSQKIWQKIMIINAMVMEGQ